MEYKLTFKKYNEALKQSKLLGLKCLDCGAITIPPKMVCQQCGSTNLEVTELKGTGIIHTFTSVFVPAEGRESECPYVIVMIKLDEGPWIMGNLEGVEPRQTTMDIMGKRVKMGFKVFAGDKYSAGESTRPLFTIEA